MRRAVRRPIALVLALAAPLVPAAPPDGDPLAEARRALARLDFDAARATLDARLAAADADDDPDEALLLRAVTRLATSDPDGALVDLRRLLDRSPDRPIAQPARLLAADVLTRLDRHLEALDRTDEVVARLRADERRHGIARLYLDAADLLLRPPSGADARTSTPPYGAAYELLRKAEELDALGPDAARVRLDLLRCADRLSRPPSERIERATAVLDAPEDEAAASEALELLGNAHRDAGDLLAARDAWFRLADRAPGSARAADVLLRLAALFLRSELDDLADLEGALAALDRLEEIPPADEEARRARGALRLDVARALAARPPLRELAVDRLERIAASPDADGRALLLLADLRAEDGAPEEALRRLSEVVAERPLDDVTRTAIRRIGEIAKGAFEAAVSAGISARGEGRARWFERARGLAARFVEHSPTDAAVPGIARTLARLELLEGRVDEAIERAREVARRFPDSDEATRARLDVARWTAEEKGEYEAALELLRALEADARNGEARRLRGELERPALRIEPPRPVSTGARPAVVVHSRNVDRLEVQLHRVDPESVFLAAGTLDGLTALDVGLIRPDATFEVALDAAPHAPHERRIELPAFDGPGAAVVTVRAGRLEARTAVIASDLDVLAVATARGTRVVADGGAPRARVASDGRLLPEDESGPARGTDARREVFAVRDGHVASATVRTDGPIEAPPRRARAWLVADRERARPGDDLRLFGVVTAPSGTERSLRLDWRDRRTGLLLRSEPVDPGPNGTISDAFAVDPSFLHPTTIDVALVGATNDDDRVVARTSVEVGPFAEPEVDAVWTTPALPLLCGETARLRATLVDRDGTPLAEERVEIALDDDAFSPVRTDRGGAVTLDVPDRRTSLPGRVRARIRARGIELRRSVPVVSRAPLVRALGRLAEGLPTLAGVDAPLAFEVRDARGAPVRTALRVRVRTVDAAPAVPDSLDVTVDTDANGRAEVPLRLAAAGTHRVHVDVDGGRGLPVRSSWPLSVVGDGDDVPVSLAPATAAPPRGAALRLTVHSELDDRPATLVYHDVVPRGERAITLPRGASEWSIPIPADARAPFRIECVVDDGSVVRRPSVAVVPAAACEVRVETDAAAARAGDALEVRIRAEGSGGALLAGEALVVLVPEEARPALVARLGDPAAALHPTVSGRFVSVGSSAAFVPPSTTVVLDDAVAEALAELERTAAAPGASVMIESLALDRILGQREELEEEQEWNDVIGVGGGAGGKFGGRYGGRGGGRASAGAATAEDGPPRVLPAPTVFRSGVALATDRPTTVTLPLPARAGRHAVLVVAATSGGRVGVGTLDVEVEEPVACELVLPTRVRTGDEPRLAARLTEREGVARDIELRLEVDGAEVERRTVAIAEHETVVPTFALPAVGRGARRVALHVDGRAIETTLRSIAPSSPDGAASRPTSGRATGEVTLRGAPSERLARLVIDGSPLARRIERALAPPPHDPRDAEGSAWAVWTSADALLAARDVEALPDALLARLEEAARSRLSSLSGLLPPPRDDVRIAPIALTALERAAAAGLDVPRAIRDPLADRVDAILAGATDPNRRAWLLFLAGRGAGAGFAMLNRLFRERESLDSTGLALLALALADAGRTAEGEAALAALASRDAPLRPARGAEGRRVSAVEFDAIVAAAAAALSADDPTIARAVEATSGADRPGRSPSPLFEILSPPVGPERAARSVVVSVGGRTVAEVTPAGVWDSTEVEIGPEDRAGDVRLTAPDGGVFHHRSAWTSGGAPAPAAVTVTRTLRRTVAVHDGRRMSISDRVVDSGGRVDLALETRRVALGRPVTEWVAVHLGDATGSFWVDVPLPAWGKVDLDSVRGADDVVLDGEVLRFRVRRPEHRASQPWVHYRVAPTAPGRYRNPPARIASARHGTRRPVGGDADPEVVVVDPGTNPDDGVPTSPDERYRLGLAAHEAGDPESARAALLPLARLPLERESFLATARTLMLASAAVGNAADTVRFFEVLKERDPSYVVPFSTMRRIGGAYRELGEPERARQIALAIVDATFLEEAQVVGRLESVGLARRAFAAMRRLLAEAGDTPAAAEIRFAFGMHAYDEAKATAPSFAGDDRRPDRAALFELATDVLLRRLALAPRAGDREEVILTLVNALVDGGRYEAGRDLAAAAAATLAADSRLGASFRFVEAHAAFALSDLDRALRLGETLASDRFPEETALLDELRAMGRHLAAQVRHARGELDAARKGYASVADRFDDAARALRWLERRGVRIPPVTRARPGEPLTLSVEHRGDASTLQVKVFPIDLRALFLKHRGLDRLDEVRLEGISPERVLESPLEGSGAGRVESEVELDLPETGAWLLLVRAGDLHARGLAVRSALAVEADVGGDAVRVHAVSAHDGRPHAGALVTFAGDRFATRRTDLRGICEVPAATNPTAAIAEADGHWAFLPIERVVAPAAADPAPSRTQSVDHLKRSQQVLEDARLRNRAIWTESTNRAQRGVEVERARK